MSRSGVNVSMSSPSHSLHLFILLSMANDARVCPTLINNECSFVVVGDTVTVVIQCELCFPYKFSMSCVFVFP